MSKDQINEAIDQLIASEEAKLSENVGQSSQHSVVVGSPEVVCDRCLSVHLHRFCRSWETFRKVIAQPLLKFFSIHRHS